MALAQDLAELRKLEGRRACSPRCPICEDAGLLPWVARKEGVDS